MNQSTGIAGGDAAPTLDEVDRVRAFNRLWTGAMRLIGRNYLGSGHSLSEVRVLYELAHHPGQTARGLAEGLGLDEGYLSRMLKRFGDDGLIARSRDPDDSRRWRLALTPAGAEAFAPFEAASRQEVGAVLATLNPAARTALATGIDAVEAALAATQGQPDLRDLGPGDAGWVIAEHGRLYARDEGYDHRFEGLVAEILAAFLAGRDPARERGWIATGPGGTRLGCIFCVREDDETARLRLFLTLPEARGTGLGKRLLTACTDFAREAGYRRMVLWTHESHRAACALYARTGWTMVASEPGEAFGQKVVDQHWERDL